MPTSKLAFEDFQLDQANAQLRRGDVLVPLTPKAFDLLCYLIEHPGELVTKEALLSALWPNLNVTETSLTVTITAIRAALGDDAKAPRFIETVTKRGYRFIASVTSASPAENAWTQEIRSPAPPPAAAAPRPRWWVGRSAAFEKLEGLFSLVLAGERQVVFVTGEAGIGKTTFVEMARERMARDGVRIFRGHCIELFGTDEAFLPLIESLRDGCDGDDGQLLLKALRAHAPTWLAQMPTLIEASDRAALQQEVFGATRERMLREFCYLLEAIGADRPFLLIIEDLHWSDFATLDALSRFARRDRKTKVLILATYRPIEAASHPASSLHQDLQIHGQSAEISLGLLSQNELDHYLVLRFNAQIAQGLAGRFYARTKGQPLFFVALADHLIAQGVLVEGEGQWRLDAEDAVAEKGMPENLREMITRQIEALTPGDQRILETASVAGFEFPAALPAAVLDRGIAEVEQVCQTLARSRQIIAPAGMAEWPDGTLVGVYAFNHALYQEVFAHRIAPGQLALTHRRLGERLELGYGARTPEIASMVALHFEEGRDYAKAIHYFELAADNSAKHFSGGEAVNYLTRALTLVEHLPAEERPEFRIKLLQKRGFIQWSGGRLLQAAEDLKLMISYAADSKQLSFEISGLMDLSLCYLYADRRECLNASVLAATRSQNLDDYFVVAQAQVYRALFSMLLIGWSDEDAAICRLALKLCADVQDPRLLLRLYAIGALVNFMVSNYEDSHVEAARGKEAAQAVGDTYLYSLCNVIESRSLLHLGCWRHLRQALPQALAMTEKNTNRMAIGLCLLMVANLHNEALDFQGAKENCEKVFDLGVEKDPFNFFIGHGILAIAYLGLQDYPAAWEQIDQLIHRIEVDGIAMDTVIYPLFYHTVCDYCLAVGDLPRAREQAMRMYEITAPPPELHYLALAHRQLSRVAMGEGDLEDAKSELERAISIVEQGNFPLAAWRVYLTAFQVYNRIGDTDSANEHLHCAEKVIATLAENFDEDDPLRASLMKGFAAELRYLRSPGPVSECC